MAVGHGGRDRDLITNYRRKILDMGKIHQTMNWKKPSRMYQMGNKHIFLGIVIANPRCRDGTTPKHFKNKQMF
jgi:hypothetical protein